MSTIETNKESDRGNRRCLGTAAMTLVTALIVAAAPPGCAVFPQSSNLTADQKITADVETGFRRHPELEAPDLINVETINRVVYLNGTVSTGVQREYAESVANQAKGVAKVIDSIAVTH